MSLKYEPSSEPLWFLTAHHLRDQSITPRPTGLRQPIGEGATAASQPSTTTTVDTTTRGLGVDALAVRRRVGQGHTVR